MTRLLLAFILINFTISGNSQSFELFDLNGNNLLNDTLKMVINNEWYGIEAQVGIKNTSSSPVKVNLTRYEIDVLPWTSGYVCWGSCTGVISSGQTPELTPNGYVTMQSQQEFEAGPNGFILHYDPNYQEGTSLWKVKFYDVDNMADTAVVFIQITSLSGVAIAENDTAAAEIYTVLNGNLIFGENQRNVELFDLCGNLIINSSNVNKLEVGHLPAGIYFLRLNKSAYKLYIGN